MNSLIKLVGNNIKEIRKAKKMTQEELAEKCGLQTSYLAGVERGDRNMTLLTLEKIIVGLEEPPANIFNFKNFDPSEIMLDKKELLIILTEILEEKSLEEVQMSVKILQEIFSTYKIKRK